MSQYTSLLPFSYMVPTFYPTSPGNVQPMNGAPQVVLSDPDLQARAQRLANVLFWTAQTYRNQEGMQDDSTLKVFIAPEFYFRKASPSEVSAYGFQLGTSFGSYPEASRQELAAALDMVVRGTPLFKDWTIVAGSICSALPRQNPGDRLNLLNTAIMLRGLRDTPDNSAQYVLMEKHYISNIDGPSASAHANQDPTTVYSFDLNPEQHWDNLIFWDGMSVGLEVCLDHSEQVVLNAVTELERMMGPAAGKLSLQLVTSCGMSLVDEAVAVVDGALVMLTDGMSQVASGLREPRFQVGRFDAETGVVTTFGNSEFDFQELPANASYQLLDYARGEYVSKKRRQGVWASKSPLPLYD
ncbi:MAG TPA: hypothetical protein VGN46_18835 [Luteibacter sp.]|uniref:hypothetical protein n=1 Tax=Luteibacter sp. TaxID=1886636 RepID=UPI002F3FAD36